MTAGRRAAATATLAALAALVAASARAPAEPDATSLVASQTYLLAHVPKTAHVRMPAIDVVDTVALRFDGCRMRVDVRYVPSSGDPDPHARTTFSVVHVESPPGAPFRGDGHADVDLGVLDPSRVTVARVDGAFDVDAVGFRRISLAFATDGTARAAAGAIRDLETRCAGAAPAEADRVTRIERRIQSDLPSLLPVVTTRERRIDALAVTFAGCAMTVRTATVDTAIGGDPSRARATVDVVTIASGADAFVRESDAVVVDFSRAVRVDAGRASADADPNAAGPRTMSFGFASAADARTAAADFTALATRCASAVPVATPTP